MGTRATTRFPGLLRHWVRLGCLCSLVCTASATFPENAEGQSEFAQLDRRIQALGGVSSLENAEQRQLIDLLEPLAKRAEMLADLFEYQLRLGSSYGLQRQELGMAREPGLPGIFRAINLGLLGNLLDARSLLSSVVNAGEATPQVAELARTWLEAFSGSPRASQSWQGKYMAWLEGNQVAAPNCQDWETACRQLNALLEDDLEQVLKIQSEIMNLKSAPLLPPRASSANSGSNDSNFSDPIVTHLAAVADNRLLAAVLRPLAEVDDRALILLFRAEVLGRESQAARKTQDRLRQQVMQSDFPEDYRALEARLFADTGEEYGALRVLSSFLDTNGTSSYAAVSELAALDPTNSQLVEQTSAARGQNWRICPNRDGGCPEFDHLARALIRMGDGEGAEALVLGNFSAAMSPLHRLLIRSHAHFISARDFGLARRDLATVAISVPVANAALGMLQELTASERAISVWVRVGGN